MCDSPCSFAYSLLPLAVFISTENPYHVPHSFHPGIEMDPFHSDGKWVFLKPMENVSFNLSEPISESSKHQTSVCLMSLPAWPHPAMMASHSGNTLWFVTPSPQMHSLLPAPVSLLPASGTFCGLPRQLHSSAHAVFRTGIFCLHTLSVRIPSLIISRPEPTSTLSFPCPPSVFTACCRGLSALCNKAPSVCIYYINVWPYVNFNTSQK